MDLWIRSQDKKQLLPASIEGLYIASGFEDDECSYIGIKNKGHIANYQNEERALEVLDEIQDTMLNLQDCNNVVIYEMPRD